MPWSRYGGIGVKDMDRLGLFTHLEFHVQKIIQRAGKVLQSRNGFPTNLQVFFQPLERFLCDDQDPQQLAIVMIRTEDSKRPGHSWAARGFGYVQHHVLHDGPIFAIGDHVEPWYFYEVHI